VCSLLLLRSFVQMVRVDPGFHADGAAIAQVRLALRKYPDRERYEPLLHDLLDRTAKTEGVSAAALAFMMPLSAGRFVVEVRLPEPAARPPIEVLLNTVSADYFRAMQIPVLRGRAFSSTDTPQSPAVAIVSARLAQALWGRVDVVDEWLHGGSPGERWRIVGVVGDVKDRELSADPQPVVYRAFSQFPANSVTLIARGESADRVAARLRVLIASIDRDIPVDGVAPLRSLVDAAVARARFVAIVVAAFAAVAVAIAVVGLYAAISYTVQARAPEIGLRLALGATRGAVVRVVAHDVGVMLATGLALGLLAGLTGAQAIRQLLFEVTPVDVTSVVLTVVTITAAAALASAGALRSALRIDPARTLHA
jgi:hypothetical protein